MTKLLFDTVLDDLEYEKLITPGDLDNQVNSSNRSIVSSFDFHCSSHFIEDTEDDLFF